MAPPVRGPLAAGAVLFTGASLALPWWSVSYVKQPRFVAQPFVSKGVNAPFLDRVLDGAVIVSGLLVAFGLAAILLEGLTTLMPNLRVPPAVTRSLALLALIAAVLLAAFTWPGTWAKQAKASEEAAEDYPVPLAHPTWWGTTVYARGPLTTTPGPGWFLAILGAVCVAGLAVPQREPKAEPVAAPPPVER